MRLSVGGLALVCTLLAACAPTLGPNSLPPVPPDPLPGADTCGRADVAGLIGQDATSLERVLIMREVRVIRPGDAVTADLRPGRINFEIDRANRIAVIRCG